MADRNEYFPTDPVRGAGGAGNVYAFSARAEMLTTDLVAGKSVGLGIMPKGAVILTGSVRPDDMDTNVSPALVLYLGDAGSIGRLLTITGGQTGVSHFSLSNASAGYVYPSDTEILLTCGTSAATAAGGYIRVNILYTFDLTNGAFRARRGG